MATCTSYSRWERGTRRVGAGLLLLSGVLSLGEADPELKAVLGLLGGNATAEASADCVKEILNICATNICE